jgi:hypothetical protein
MSGLTVVQARGEAGYQPAAHVNVELKRPGNCNPGTAATLPERNRFSGHNLSKAHANPQDHPIKIKKATFSISYSEHLDIATEPRHPFFAALQKSRKP